VKDDKAQDDKGWQGHLRETCQSRKNFKESHLLWGMSKLMRRRACSACSPAMWCTAAHTSLSRHENVKAWGCPRAPKTPSAGPPAASAARRHRGLSNGGPLVLGLVAVLHWRRDR